MNINYFVIKQLRMASSLQHDNVILNAIDFLDVWKNKYETI